MHRARILKLAKVATELSNAGNYEAALALRWIAYEALVARAAIKGLWMRAATVKEAESVIMRLPPRSPTMLLVNCCGNAVDLNDDRYLILRHIKDRAHLRNLLFHQLNVASKEQLLLLSNILARTLANPTTALGNVELKVSGVRVSLGDPLVDLRRVKRRPRVKKRSVAELLRYKESSLQAMPTLPDLTEDDVTRLFSQTARRITREESSCKESNKDSNS